jgi:hypothetical protein
MCERKTPTRDMGKAKADWCQLNLKSLFPKELKFLTNRESCLLMAKHWENLLVR